MEGNLKNHKKSTSIVKKNIIPVRELKASKQHPWKSAVHHLNNPMTDPWDVYGIFTYMV